MDGSGLDAHVLELAGEAVRAVLGRGEDHGAVAAVHDRCGDLRLVHLVDGQEAVGHLLDRRAGRGDLVAGRVGLVAADQHVDDAVERGREQQRLVIALDVAQDPLDLRQEAHVGHAVRLVDDHVLDIGDREVTALDQVDRSTGGADHQVDTVLERLDLLLDRVAAVDRGDPHTTQVRQREQLVAHLRGELAGGHQSDAGRSTGLGLGQDLEHREPEGEGLAGARLRLPADVTTGKDVRDGHLLDRERRGDAPFGECMAQVLGHAELFEGCRHVHFKFVEWRPSYRSGPLHP